MLETALNQLKYTWKVNLNILPLQVTLFCTDIKFLFSEICNSLMRHAIIHLYM